LFSSIQHCLHGLALYVVPIQLTLVVCQSAEKDLLVLVRELELDISLQPPEHVRVDGVAQNAGTSEERTLMGAEKERSGKVREKKGGRACIGEGGEGGRQTFVPTKDKEEKRGH
jgi:hypothetical protein